MRMLRRTSTGFSISATQLRTASQNRSVRYPHTVHSSSLPSGDRRLVQIVDSALADVTHRSGKWLVCRPSCTQCCIGVFPINQLDAVRLRKGLANLEQRAPEGADRVRQRAQESVARLSKDFPGDPTSGLLDEGEEAEQRLAE